MIDKFVTEISPRSFRHFKDFKCKFVSNDGVSEHCPAPCFAKDQDLEIRVYFITPINNINAITHSGPNKICTEFIQGLSQRPQVGICLEV